MLEIPSSEMSLLEEAFLKKWWKTGCDDADTDDDEGIFAILVEDRMW